MVKHAVEIGWTPLTRRCRGEARRRRAGMLFRDELEAKLAQFNPWLYRRPARSIVETLEALPATIEGNREMLAWLRGERQWYDEDEKRQRPVQVIDFDHPGNNALPRHLGVEARSRRRARATAPTSCSSSTASRSASSSTRTRRTATRSSAAIKQLRRYEVETPELLGAPQLFNVTHLLDYWYGVTWNANRRFIARGSRRREETYRFAVQAFFEPTDFLRTLQHWILFYVEDGETRKSVLRAAPARARSTRSSRAAPTRRRPAGSSGTRRAPARPSRCSRRRA